MRLCKNLRINNTNKLVSNRLGVHMQMVKVYKETSLLHTVQSHLNQKKSIQIPFLCLLIHYNENVILSLPLVYLLPLRKLHFVIKVLESTIILCLTWNHLLTSILLSNGFFWYWDHCVEWKLDFLFVVSGLSFQKGHFPLH